MQHITCNINLPDRLQRVCPTLCQPILTGRYAGVSSDRRICRDKRMPQRALVTQRRNASGCHAMTACRAAKVSELLKAEYERCKVKESVNEKAALPTYTRAHTHTHAHDPSGIFAAPPRLTIACLAHVDGTTPCAVLPF